VAGSRHPRVAFAVRGTVLDHFARAAVFRIVEIDGAEHWVVEDRQVQPAADSEGHNESGFDRVLAALADCQALVVGRIGPGAATHVMKTGIRLFQGSGAQEGVMRSLIRAGVFESGRSAGPGCGD